MENKRQVEEQNYVEEVGIIFEQTGLPRMAGRILGWLIIADPPHQSATQITEALIASKGSISTITRLLIQLGLIERVSLPGVRQDFFRIRADAWHHMIKRGLKDEIHMVRHMAERGLELLADRAPLSRKWLEEMRDVYIFLEQEFPGLLERWEQQQPKDKALTRQFGGNQ